MSKHSIVRSILLAGVAAGAAPAAAQDEADEPEGRDYLSGGIVVIGQIGEYLTDDGSTATKTPTPLIDVPQTVTVITGDQLEDQAITQLNDALRFVPGVSLETGEGHRDEVFIRGQETTADFYLDGLRDDAQYYRSLYNVDRVEVLKGANALIFGRGGGGGAINRVSKQADPAMPFGAFGGSVDSFGAFALSGDVNAPLTGGVGMRINATYEEFANHRDFFEGRFIGISPTLTAQIGPDTRLVASYTYDDDERVTDRGVPSFQGRPLTGFDETFFGDPDFNRTEAEVHILRGRLEHDFSSDLSVNASVQYADYDKVYANIVPSGTNGTVVTLGGYQDAQQRENLLGQANLVWNARTGNLDNTLLAGVEFMRQDSQNQRRNAIFSGTNTAPLAEIIAVPPFSLGPLIRDRDSELSVFSAYIQDQLSIGEHIELVAGLRFERFDLETAELLTGTPGDRVDEEVSPRIAAIFKPIENLSLYASYAESFLPQSGDQFFLLTPTTASFEPEKFENLELGAKWAIDPELLLTAAIFRLDRSNSRAPDPNNTGLTVLTGESRVEGFEIALAGEVVDKLNVSLGYAYLDGEITETTSGAAAGTTLQQVPEHHVTAWARYDATDRIGFGAGLVHMSSQFASMSNNVVLPSYTRVDTAIFFDVTENVALQLNVENLFDEEYYPSAHGDNNIQPAEPLNATLSARIRF